MVMAALASACLMTPAAALAQDDDYLEHRLKPGESPYTLARDYLSSPQAYAQLVRVNRIANARRLPVGTIIRLPRNLLAYRAEDLRIEAFSGQVTINGQPAARGMAVPEGATIRTGGNGFVSLRGSAGSVLTMPTNTQAQLVRARVYRLDDLKDIEFKVLGGRGEAQVPGLRLRERFNLGTPKTVSAVRGTVFRVGFDDAGDRSVVEVVEGAVATAVGAQQALTSAGFGIAATPAGLSPQERLLPPPQITEPGAIQTQPTVSFAIALPDLAVGIRTQIARDAGFSDIIGEQISTGKQPATFADIEDGRYFVRARAISASGIEGNSEVYSFRRKRLGASASAQPSALDDGYRFVWLSDGVGETTFAFQLWNTARPADLIVDEIAMDRQGILVSDLAPGTYEWRVAAMQIDDEGLLQVWGPTQRLNVTE
jgi:hypothetical protein